MEKRTVGRPKKTSTKVVKEKKYVNWKEQHDLVASELALTKELLVSITENANGVVEKQADKQLDIVKLTLDSYNTIEKHCERVTKLTGNIEESDVLYLTSVARRALLHKFVEFNEAEED
tara:strand:- start:854 stop:1210 length:357 start_codon:yes stop_codon:yes gene_type:complete